MATAESLEKLKVGVSIFDRKQQSRGYGEAQRRLKTERDCKWKSCDVKDRGHKKVAYFFSLFELYGGPDKGRVFGIGEGKETA